MTPVATLTLVDAVIDSIDATVLTAVPTIPAVAHLTVAAVVEGPSIVKSSFHWQS